MKRILLVIFLISLVMDFCFAQKTVQVTDQLLNEISGIDASKIHRGLYYVHNDSGGKGEVYILNSKGKVVSILALAGTINRDWEDIAIGPDPASGVSHIYIGEIGDNDARYEQIYLYRIKEPKLKFFRPKKPQTIVVNAVESFRIAFEDGPHDCETLMIDPANGDVYLVSKREAKVGVYHIKAPLKTGSLNVAKRILSLDFTLAVGGDISPQRNKIIIKTYNIIYQWQIKPGQSIAEALSQTPEILPYKVEPQGEAVCYSANGKSYLTISERKSKNPLYLFIYSAVNTR